MYIGTEARQPTYIARSLLSCEPYHPVPGTVPSHHPCYIKLSSKDAGRFLSGSTLPSKLTQSAGEPGLVWLTDQHERFAFKRALKCFLL